MPNIATCAATTEMSAFCAKYFVRSTSYKCRCNLINGKCFDLLGIRLREDNLGVIYDAK